MSRLMFVTMLGCLFVRAAEAEEPAIESPMSQLARMAGNWQGSGWIEMNGQRFEFEGNERVRFQLNGTILLIEGTHHAKGAAADAPPVHEVLGVMAYDRREGQYQMHAFTTRRGATVADATVADVSVNDDQIAWRFQAGSRQFRYEITIEGDQWNETGAYSIDGTSWTEFFGMKLARRG